jgi:hypothetical protein
MPELALQVIAGLSLAIGSIIGIGRWWKSTPFVRFSIVVGIFHIVSVSIMTFIDNGGWNSTVTFFETNMQCVDGSGCTVTPSHSEFKQFPVVYPIVLSGIISGFFHLMTWDDTSLITGVNPYRWIDYAFSSSLMVVAIAMLFGVTDIFIILETALFQCGLMLFTMVMEGNEGLSTYAYFVPSVLFYLWGVWSPIIITFYTNTGNRPGFVELIVWAIFAVFAAFGAVFWVFKVHKWIDNNRAYEFSYMGLSLCAKTTLTWTFYGGAAALGDSDSINAVGWGLGGSVLGGIALTVFGIVFIQPRGKPAPKQLY